MTRIDGFVERIDVEVGISFGMLEEDRLVWAEQHPAASNMERIHIFLKLRIADLRLATEE